MRRLLGLAALALAPLPAAAQDDCPCPPPSPPPPDWNGSLGAGLALTSGNSDTRSYNFSFEVVHDPKRRNAFKAEGLYLRSDTGGQATVNRTTAAARDEYSLGQRSFVFGELAYQRDEFKELSYLIAPLAGVGYKLVNRERLSLALDVAAGGAFEKYFERGSTTSGALKAGQALSFEISESAKLEQRFAGLWKMQDLGDATYHVGAGLTTSVARRLELKLAYTWDYKSRPPLATIRKGDNSFLASLVFKVG